jgi:hypothetical protein
MAGVHARGTMRSPRLRGTRQGLLPTPMRIFLSHASEDKARVQALQAALPPHVQVWLDVDQLYAGHRLDEELRRAILDENDYVIVFVGPHALESEWVAQELAWALEVEADLGRPYVVPVFLPGTPAQPPAGSAFAPLWQRIYLAIPDDPVAAGTALAAQLFALASAWIETTAGSSRRRFIARLRRDLTRFKDDAYLMLAAMGVPLPVLCSRAEAHAQFAAATTAYAQFAAGFVARKDGLREQVHQLFGGYLAAEAEKLLAFVEQKVYRGRLYELNPVVDAVNRFGAQAVPDPAARAEAEADKARRLEAARKVLEQMTKRSLDLLAKLELEAR